MNARLFAAAALGFALCGLAPAVSAPPPPPPPSNVQIVKVEPGARTVAFDVIFAPAMIDATHNYPTYDFSIAPKGCGWSAPVAGAFHGLSYAGPPYKVSLVCPCGKIYTAQVATAQPDAYTPRSAWIKSSPVTMACKR